MAHEKLQSSNDCEVKSWQLYGLAVTSHYIGDTRNWGRSHINVAGSSTDVQLSGRVVSAFAEHDSPVKRLYFGTIYSGIHVVYAYDIVSGQLQMDKQYLAAVQLLMTKGNPAYGMQIQNMAVYYHCPEAIGIIKQISVPRNSDDPISILLFNNPDRLILDNSKPDANCSHELPKRSDGKDFVIKQKDAGHTSLFSEAPTYPAWFESTQQLLRERGCIGKTCHNYTCGEREFVAVDDITFAAYKKGSNEVTVLPGTVTEYASVANATYYKCEQDGETIIVPDDTAFDVKLSRDCFDKNFEWKISDFKLFITCKRPGLSFRVTGVAVTRKNEACLLGHDNMIAMYITPSSVLITVLGEAVYYESFKEE